MNICLFIDLFICPLRLVQIVEDRFDLNIFYCISTYTKGLNTSSYNLRGSHLKYN